MVAKQPTPQEMAAALKGYGSMQMYSPGTQRAARQAKALQDQLDALRAPHNIYSPGQLGVELLADVLMERKLDKRNAALDESYRSDLANELSGQLGRWGAGEKPSFVPAQEPAKIPAGTTPPIVPQKPSRAPIEVNELPPIAAPKPGVADLWGALERQESGGNQGAVSPKGAFGVAQLMPGTAAEVAAKMGDPTLADRARTDPGVNRQLGQAYLQEQLDAFGSPALALAAYNAGPGRVQEWIQRFGDPRTGAISEADWAKRIPFPETRNYVASVLGATGPTSPQPPAAQPYDVASIGATPPPPTPSAGLSAPASPGGAAPSATPPPAGAGGANPLGPTPGEIDLYKQLLARGDLQGAREFAAKINERMAKPPEYDVQVVNGVPFRIDPRTGQAIRVSVDGAQDRIVSARDLGINAPEGTFFSVDPNGRPTKVVEPPSGYQRGAGGLSLERGGPQDPTAGGALIEGEAKLRAEYGKAVGDYQVARDGYEKVVAGANDATGAGDVALIYGVMKVLDPTSVVREGEAATVQNTGSVPERISGLYNRVLNGERLTPAQRAEFVKMARGQFSVYEQRARAANERFSTLATSYGFNPGRIVSDLRPVSEGRPAAPAAPPKPQTGGPQFTVEQLRAEKARREAARGGAR